MSSVGETLRRERLRKELGLEQISRETKISARLLEAIENNRFDMLPGGVFAKSFVRQYARFLGLDEEEMAAEVEKAVNPVGDMPSFTSAAPEPAFKVPRMVEWEGGGRSNSSVLPALALVVAVMLVCSVVYAWWQRSRRPAAPAPPVTAAQKAPAAAPKPAAPAPVTPAVASNPESAPKTDVSTAAAPPETPPAQSAATLPPESVNPAATLQVSLTADADDWVRVSTDGKVAMSDVLHPGETKTFAAEEAVRVRVGDAGSLQMTVNGKPAGPLGPKGQVRNVEVTRDGVHILPAPPKPAPAPALEPL
ncbi:MAG: helix-turn-helix domain-containing protein [Bryobacteraceae bacterium]|jgi:cytoskeleton protein RodZ